MTPEYSKSNIRHTIRDDEFKKIMIETPNPRDRFFLAILYCTGARPSEIAGDRRKNKDGSHTELKGMTYGDIDVDLDKAEIRFNVPISKVEKGKYSMEYRKLVLSFDKENPELPVRIVFDMLILEDNIRKRSGLETDPKKQLFNFCRKTGYNIVERAGKIIGVEICPYNFRHSRLTLLSEQGAGIETLMYFKGSKNIKSIATYLHARDIHYKLKKS